MHFAPSLQLSEMFCSAVAIAVGSPTQPLTVQQTCAFLWGIARVARMQESATHKSPNGRMVDTYGGKGLGWQRAAGPAMPDSAQVWQEIIMPPLRAAQSPLAASLELQQPHHARVRLRMRSNFPAVVVATTSVEVVNMRLLNAQHPLYTLTIFDAGCCSLFQ